MRYVISRQCRKNIVSFYQHVAKKYKHTYSEWLMYKNTSDALNAIYRIEQTLPRRLPTLTRWQHYHMAHAAHWYYAYTIAPDGTVVIEDACHEQNMHE